MTRSVDYDRIASEYSLRYERSAYEGIERALAAFLDVGTSGPQSVCEVGCGTGHWLQWLQNAGVTAVGVDRSMGMLKVAAGHTRARRLARAMAEALPFRRGSLTRVFCVNALHHFADPTAFFREAMKVLRPGGGLLTVGLDPHTGHDQWWIYDYFPQALTEDKKRYLPTAAIRALMEAAGFVRCESREVQHSPRSLSLSDAAQLGFLDRASTSQLMVISDAEYEAGIERIHRASRQAEGLVLTADLRLYGTMGWMA
jgi:ubiquinone/menaquinone biosynthesis C-methylase UbiE